MPDGVVGTLILRRLRIAALASDIWGQLMSYKVYAGVQTGVDVWKTKTCIYDPTDYTDTKKIISQSDTGGEQGR